MKAIILAAGQGTRLKKYTENLPKGMLKFEGKTIIERQIEMYKSCGIDDISIVRGYAADKIAYSGVTYYTNFDYSNTNMVESLLTAKREFSDDIIVSYSDILFNKMMVENMMSAECDFGCAVDMNWKEYWKLRYGTIDTDTESLKINEDNSIIELGFEAPDLDRIDARYIGLLKFSRDGLVKILKIMEKAYEQFADGSPWQQSGKPAKKAYMTDLLNALIESGEQVKAIKFNNGWIEFDTNDDYDNACIWAKDGRLKRIIELN